jgi:hypothetical protein
MAEFTNERNHVALERRAISTVPIIIAMQVRQSTRNATLWMKASVVAIRNGALGKGYIGYCNITWKKCINAYGNGEWDGMR